jgi:hypothetical protein
MKGGATMAYERDRDNYRDYRDNYDDKKKKECNNCVIKIEDSIVVLVCGDVDIDKLKDSLGAFAAEKGNNKCY